MRKHRFFWAVAVLLALGADPASFASDIPPRNVLLLHSYHKGFAWTDRITAGIESTFEKEKSAVALRVEYMDTMHVDDPDHYRILHDLYRHKFGNTRFDAVISSDDDAFRFLLARRKELFPGVPMVFFGVSGFTDASLAGQEDVTGIVESFDVKKTLDVALKTHPETRQVYVYVDNSARGIANRRKAEEALAGYEGKVKGVFIENFHLDEVRGKGFCLPPAVIVLMMTVPRDPNGNVSEENLRYISDRCNVPIYSVWDSFLGRGIVGGMITSGFSQGEAAAKLALRILAGEKAGSIPVVKESPNRYMFDHKQLRRFGIEAAALPEGSVFVNPPYSLYRERPEYVWGFAAVVAVLASIIAVLAANILRRRRAEEAMKETNLRLQTLIEAIPDVVVFKDTRRRHLIVNKACEAMTGRSREEIVGKTEADLLPPDLAEYCRKSDEEVLNRREIVRSEECIACEDGETSFFHTVKAPLYDGKGSIMGLVVVSRDITGLKKGEAELRASEERYRMLVETSPDGIVRFDPEGKILLASRQTLRMMGYESGEEFLGRKIFEFIGTEDWERTAEDLSRILTTGTVPLVRYTLVRKDGSRFPAECSATLVTGRDGKPDSVIAVVRDITEKESLEKQLSQAMKMEAVGRLAGGLAHDINNYLGAITGFSDLVKMTHGNDQTLARRMDTISETAFRASSLIRQLLAFSRRQPTAIEVLNLNQVIRRMENMMRRLIGEDVMLGARLTANPRNVKADPSQVEQVLVNLLVNARDAMPRGGEVTIETDNVDIDDGTPRIPVYMKKGKYLMLAVSDTGTGVPEEIREKIFEPFFTTKETGKGSGLGLSTVYGIVKQHNGYIQVHNNTGKGATFRVYLPACGDGIPPPERISSDPPRPLRGLERVLLAEDNEDVRISVIGILEALGYRVFAVPNGEEALDLFDRKREEIDLLITDVVMPGMGGKALADRAREMKKELKVLFISGYPDDIIANHGILHEGIYFLQKPFSAGALSGKIREMFN